MSVWPEERVRDEVEAAGGRSEVALEALRSAFGVRFPTPQAYGNVQKWLEGVGVGVEPPLTETRGTGPVTLYLLDRQEIATGMRRSTAEALRRGDRSVLSSFFESRQAAVVAYCSAICDPGRIAEAVEAAFADLFTMLRSNGAVEDADLDEALLKSTRSEAAERAASGGDSSPLNVLQGAWGRSAACQLMPRMLAARGNSDLSPSDQERVNRHLRRCGGGLAMAPPFPGGDPALPAPRAAGAAGLAQ